MKVLVLGYSGPLSAVVDRWRMKVAMDTLHLAGGGSLVITGHDGEAQRLAELVPSGTDVVLETAALSTWQNVEFSIPLLEDAARIAIASDFFHARRAARYMQTMRPDLMERIVTVHRRWPRGLWMDLAGGLDVVRREIRRSRLGERGSRPTMGPDDRAM